ncbi:MAG: hypothetical protein B6I20_08105 [Bacteroidetes bacterium 4572_117]|nr:MAG: hypothetical protein B6I20_08105 [Bacteroidetes bacterium 4572_117]
MQTKSINPEEFELDVYGFSINIVSFVKTLEKSGKTNETINKLVIVSNGFYSDFTNIIEAETKHDKENYINESIKKAKLCLGMLESINLENGLLNEKVDLIIEVAGLIKKIERL